MRPVAVDHAFSYAGVKMLYMSQSFLCIANHPDFDSVLVCTSMLLMCALRLTRESCRGVRREVLRGSGGAVSPPARSGVEPRKILKLTLFRG